MKWILTRLLEAVTFSGFVVAIYFLMVGMA